VCRRELSRSADAFRGEGAWLAQRYFGELPELPRMSPGEQWAHASPHEMLWIALPCRGGLLGRAQRSRGEQSSHAAPGEALWIGLRCRAEPPESRKCARDAGSMRRCRARVLGSAAMSRGASMQMRRAGVPACSPMARLTISPGGMERTSPGEKVWARRRECAGGERAAVPGPTPERAEPRSGSPPRRRSSPPTEFLPGTGGPRRRTPAAGATRSASRRPRCRRRPTAPRRSGPPRGTGWCSR
jgi:hypothetical protein